jgi:hypothetical protein
MRNLTVGVPGQSAALDGTRSLDEAAATLDEPDARGRPTRGARQSGLATFVTLDGSAEGFHGHLNMHTALEAGHDSGGKNVCYDATQPRTLQLTPRIKEPKEAAAAAATTRPLGDADEEVLPTEPAAPPLSGRPCSAEHTEAAILQCVQHEQSSGERGDAPRVPMSRNTGDEAPVCRADSTQGVAMPVDKSSSRCAYQRDVEGNRGAPATSEPEARCHRPRSPSSTSARADCGTRLLLRDDLEASQQALQEALEGGGRACQKQGVNFHPWDPCSSPGSSCDGSYQIGSDSGLASDIGMRIVDNVTVVKDGMQSRRRKASRDRTNPGALGAAGLEDTAMAVDERTQPLEPLNGLMAAEEEHEAGCGQKHAGHLTLSCFPGPCIQDLRQVPHRPCLCSPEAILRTSLDHRSLLACRKDSAMQ